MKIIMKRVPIDNKVLQKNANDRQLSTTDKKDYLKKTSINEIDKIPFEADSGICYTKSSRTINKLTFINKNNQSNEQNNISNEFLEGYSHLFNSRKTVNKNYIIINDI
jgi:hypothetical protein